MKIIRTYRVLLFLSVYPACLAMQSLDLANVTLPDSFTAADLDAQRDATWLLYHELNAAHYRFGVHHGWYSKDLTPEMAEQFAQEDLDYAYGKFENCKLIKNKDEAKGLINDLLFCAQTRATIIATQKAKIGTTDSNNSVYKEVYNFTRLETLGQLYELLKTKDT